MPKSVVYYYDIELFQNMAIFLLVSSHTTLGYEEGALMQHLLHTLFKRPMTTQKNNKLIMSTLMTTNIKLGRKKRLERCKEQEIKFT
jgi:hypothetical protein